MSRTMTCCLLALCLAAAPSPAPDPARNERGELVWQFGAKADLNGTATQIAQTLNGLSDELIEQIEALAAEYRYLDVKFKKEEALLWGMLRADKQYVKATGALKAAEAAMKEARRVGDSDKVAAANSQANEWRKRIKAMERRVPASKSLRAIRKDQEVIRLRLAKQKTQLAVQLKERDWRMGVIYYQLRLRSPVEAGNLVILGTVKVVDTLDDNVLLVDFALPTKELETGAEREGITPVTFDWRPVRLKVIGAEVKAKPGDEVLLDQAFVVVGPVEENADVYTLRRQPHKDIDELMAAIGPSPADRHRAQAASRAAKDAGGK